MNEPLMTQYVIYDHPREFPDFFVLYRWHVFANGSKVRETVAMVGNKPEELRELIPPDHTLTPLKETEDPNVLEVWI